ncbi:tRNA (guanine-N(7)-)-methyltransferase non-catalytic subunit trm82 [Sporothrix epigloea]|uniref:tRNA (Guanine-N(7)-)-methyltransferase non-catalytic subunit trm82 n=1 Tax=Sporothrix epigloea TaxID=1892477 RepID=A0ABP0DT29_9PEZI
MTVAFHRLKVCGDILVAARGASLHTFHIADGSHIAAWRVPQSKCEAEKTCEAGEAGEAGEETAEADGGDRGPPSKRRKVDEADNAATGDAGQLQNGGSSKTKKGKERKAQAAAEAAKAQKFVALRTADLPVVSLLEATKDGRHLVVMMGHDKTLRVLAHDLAGHLTQLSVRVMPKRPCAVAFTADDQTILSGDKFGDVYALPLIEVEKTEAEQAAEQEAAARKAEEEKTKLDREAAVVAPRRLEANQFTVHTKGNRQALENQRRQKELLLQQGLDQQKRDAENSSSKYQLLLGHVSMLTAVTVAEGYAKGEIGQESKKARRPLILTADRDEHIRVTRGVVGATATASQTHVIETFCLGHTSFVSRLCIPRSRPDRLVSGGGDGDLFVWDFWPEGRLVGTADLASLVAKVDGSSEGEAAAAPRVALSGLYSLGAAAQDPNVMADDDGAAYANVAAICERVPAIFFFRVAPDGSTLFHTQTLRLPAGHLPLDVAEVDKKLVVATAAAEEDEATVAPSVLLSLTCSKDGWAVSDTAFASLPAATEDDDTVTATLDRAVLRRLLLHSNESLRKDNDSEE